ncbi:rIIa-like protein [Stenotrophomonas phage C121]|uniref:RIIA lysis inhibitor n=1 Tax=Stenotrophomonas phage C121 TaxID=2914029 RepID=UPI0023297F19|nr:RIIA lysis inhibitor [Stenotrophomonas phage C121]UKL14790.1 rIIa-like protein [Stenotrophomonas phage C121]
MEVANTDRRANAALIGSTGESKAAKVAESRAFIEMLTSNLYSRPKEAFLREVICNADDAHKMNGYEGPIEITLQDGTLTIRDRGPGIPHDKFADIYLTYGGSTKTGDSMATGGFGLGCKSPWSYTDVFTVTNHHAGKMTINSLVRVSPEHDGMPAIVPLMDLDTEETGIEVQIDIRKDDLSGIQSLIIMLVNHGGLNATLNGVQLRTIEYDTKNNFTFVQDSNMGNWLMIKYGAVVYPVMGHEIYNSIYDQLKSWVGFGSTIVLHAPADSLVISPNRENISYLDKSVKTIWELIRELFKAVNKFAEPVARKAIAEGNSRYIDSTPMSNVMDTYINSCSYLTSPQHSKHTSDMSVIEQIVYSAITRSYPAQLWQFDQKDRANKIITKYGTTPQIRRRLKSMIDAVNNWGTYKHNKQKTLSLIEDVYVRPMLRNLYRRGMPTNKLYVCSTNYGFYNQESGRSTYQPMKVEKLFECHNWSATKVIRTFYRPQVVISHNVRDMNVSHLVNNEYFVYVVDRSKSSIDAAIDLFSKLDFEVVDITHKQVITKAPSGVKKTELTPTLAFVYATKEKNYRNEPYLHVAKRATVVDMSPISDMEVYVTCSFRGNLQVTLPDSSLDSSLWHDFRSLLNPAKTAIITTQTEEKRLRKAGAISFAEFVGNWLIEQLGNAEVRRMLAYLPHRGVTSKYGNSERLNVLQSPALRNIAGIQWNIDSNLYQVRQRINRIADNVWYMEERFKSDSPYVKALDLVKKIGMNTPIKLAKAIDRINSNVLLKVEGTSLDLASLLDAQNKSTDPVVKDRINRIVSIIMEP